MSLSDEPAVVAGKSKLKAVVLIVAIALFVFSLFNNAFCTENGCRSSIECLLIGWLAMLTGGSALSWLANPFLIITWILLGRNRKHAWIFGLVARILSVSFLSFQVVIENEAGHLSQIIKIGFGYWLWVSSCLITFTGSLLLTILKTK